MPTNRLPIGRRDWPELLADSIPEFIRPLARRMWVGWRRSKALAELRRARLGVGRHHGLPGELIVSLTSYPARFATLCLTLRSLLAQTVKPDRLILWIAREDMHLVPADVRQLAAFDLEIRECDDLRSYKKLVPALEAFPDAFIVTADDDIYYPPDWLEMLVHEFNPSAPVVVCHRAHRLVRAADGAISPYLQWRLDVQDERARSPSADIMPTSGAGALYPPRSLHRIVTERAQFERLCPDSDDLWFYWCSRMAGTPSKKVGSRMWLVPWAGTQSDSLWQANRRGANDAAVAALEQEFG